MAKYVKPEVFVQLHDLFMPSAPDEPLRLIDDVGGAEWKFNRTPVVGDRFIMGTGTYKVLGVRRDEVDFVEAPSGSKIYRALDVKIEALECLDIMDDSTLVFNRMPEVNEEFLPIAARYKCTVVSVAKPVGDSTVGKIRFLDPEEWTISKSVTKAFLIWKSPECDLTFPDVSNV